MNFAEQLQKAAEESGHKTIQGKKEEAPVSENMEDFASTLQKAKAKSEEVEEIEIVTDLGPVDKWSFSTLKDFEQCPLKVKMAKVDKIPQKESEAGLRGTAIHDMCEDYVRGNIPKLVGDKKTQMAHFQESFDQLKVKFEEGKVTCEENWGIRLDWSPCTWDDEELWGRAKLDVFVREDKTSCRIIDYKTGRKFGNELKHADQGLSYALHAYHRFPEIESFQVEFWYLDQAEKTIRTFTRKQLTVLLARYHKRATALTSCKDFHPKPGVSSCQFCSYGSNSNKQGMAYGTGDCQFDHYRG